MLAAQRRRSLTNGRAVGFISGPLGPLAWLRTAGALPELTFSGNRPRQETGVRAGFHIYERRHSKGRPAESDARLLNSNNEWRLRAAAGRPRVFPRVCAYAKWSPD